MKVHIVWLDLNHDDMIIYADKIKYGKNWTEIITLATRKLLEIDNDDIDEITVTP